MEVDLENGLLIERESRAVVGVALRPSKHRKSIGPLAEAAANAQERRRARKANRR